MIEKWLTIRYSLNGREFVPAIRQADNALAVISDEITREKT